MKKIRLGKKKHILVDDEDYKTLSKYKWNVDALGYVSRSIKNKTTLIHRIILNAQKGQMIDHIDLIIKQTK